MITNTEITIREFRRGDLDTVRHLISHVVNVSYRGAYPEAALRMYRNYHSAENILNDAVNGYCVVAEIDGKIVGTGMLLENWIRRVYIDPDCQKGGVGSRIYGALEGEAVRRGLTRLELGASVIAPHFWEKHGFTVEKEEDIPAGNDFLKFFIMSKDLTAGTKID